MNKNIKSLIKSNSFEPVTFILMLESFIEVLS